MLAFLKAGHHIEGFGLVAGAAFGVIAAQLTSPSWPDVWLGYLPVFILIVTIAGNFLTWYMGQQTKTAVAETKVELAGVKKEVVEVKQVHGDAIEKVDKGMKEALVVLNSGELALREDNLSLAEQLLLTDPTNEGRKAKVVAARAAVDLHNAKLLTQKAVSQAVSDARAAQAKMVKPPGGA